MLEYERLPQGRRRHHERPDPYGNHVDYGAAGSQLSAGLGIGLERDAQGRIAGATDPAGKSLVYAYNAQGELQSVTDRAGRTTSFCYTRTTRQDASGSINNRHLLQSIATPMAGSC